MKRRDEWEKHDQTGPIERMSDLGNASNILTLTIFRKRESAVKAKAHFVSVKTIHVKAFIA